MILAKDTHKIIRNENVAGGKGPLTIEQLLTAEQMKDQCGLFAHVVIEPNCSLGYHEHHGEGEAYYIIKGTGKYSDNGTDVVVNVGDVVFCPDGEGHGIENLSADENLEFIALIIKTAK